ncbi:DUF456 domain-containing protein [Desulfotomaculum copahuensis]|uniref:DUF456 domain-containing protein n=1 Tax=Desulfotomaculum copahuensis TaxID=1838280 RepID=A0A1B7LH21_9FIRM|nr:DUF456 domain-containing protein [Desulfotomaculum copahuensis]OAT85500.1 hypothetical protein A6M21_06190 [Desulfotomaculum copahuensis]
MACLLISCFFFAAGLAATMTPVLPGVPLIWLGMAVYGLSNGFTVPGRFFYLTVTVAAFCFTLPAIGGRRRAFRRDLSGEAVWGGMLGVLAGVLSLGAAGMFWGPPVGAVFAELLAGKPLNRAVPLAFGTLAGLAGNKPLKMLLQLTLIGWFFYRTGMR